MPAQEGVALLRGNESKAAFRKRDPRKIGPSPLKASIVCGVSMQDSITSRGCVRVREDRPRKNGPKDNRERRETQLMSGPTPQQHAARAIVRAARKSRREI